MGATDSMTSLVFRCFTCILASLCMLAGELGLLSFQMLRRCRKPVAVLTMCILYGLLSLYSAYKLVNRDKFNKLRTTAHQYAMLGKSHERVIQEDNKVLPFAGDYSATNNMRLEIWDTSGVGIYMWQHILGGMLPETDHNGWYENSQTTDKLHMWYKLGYGLLPKHGPPVLNRNMFLALNGRDLKVQEHAKLWLDYVLSNSNVKNLGLLLLGAENCDNLWLNDYLKFEKLRLVFLIYDSIMIDNKRIFEWPLGVASYRNFPAISPSSISFTGSRKYVCNFIGTTYPKSSREFLMKFVKQAPMNQSNCVYKWRNRWVKDESLETAVSYQHVLANSDLTLSPAGINAECYRTYEAIELGSIPIVEDIPTPACDRSSPSSNATSPYFVLKKHKAPLIYVKSWHDELPDIIRDFNNLSLSRKVRKRLDLLRWYVDFRNSMKAAFIRNVLKLFDWK